jgi:hypothetical protein
MRTCAGCGKPVKGTATMVVPSNLEIMLGVASIQYFHPSHAPKPDTVILKG